MNNTCRICDGNIGTFKSILLIDGGEIHDYCYNFLLNPKLDNDRTLEILYKELNTLKLALSKNNSIIKSLGRLFNEKSRIFYTRLQNTIKKIENEIRPIEYSINETRELCNKKLKEIYDIWYERPPDWSDRQDIINRKYNNCCSICGNRKYLQVHHLLPINSGGNHKVDNLILLCRSCHEDEHGGVNFSGEYNKNTTKSQFMGRLSKIKKSLKDSNDIYFHYRKYEGEESSRRLTPKGLRMEGTSLCVFGYCHLRKDDRVFAIRRMSKVEIIN